MFGIRRRLFIAFGGTFLILLALSLFTTRIFSRATASIRHAVIDDLDSVIAARDMHDALDVIDESAEHALRTGSPLDAARVSPAVQSFDSALTLQFQRLDLPGEDAQTAGIQKSWTTIRQSLAELDLAADVAARERTILGRLLPTIRQTRPLLTTLASGNIDTIKGSHGAVQDSVASARWTVRAITFVGLVVAAAFATLMGRGIVRPLSVMTTTAVAISRGELDQRIPVHGDDEIGKLAEAFNRMSVELQRFRALDADKLQRTYRTTQTAIDSLPDGVVLLDEHGRVELANQTAARLFNVTAGQQLLDGDAAPWLTAAVERPGAGFDNYRTAVQIDDHGTRRYFLPQAIALNGDGPDARVIGTTLILTDVTDFHRLDQMKDSLLSMASHELKTPLQCLCVVVPLLLDRRTGPLNDDQRELLTAARDSSERMSNIVEQILDLGRLKSGRIPLELKPVDAAELVQPTVAALAPAFERHGVRLDVDCGTGLPPVRCDPGKIDHVLTNLLNNALRFTPRGGRVSITASLAGNAVAFRVADTGCGIPPEHLPRIFETFYRVPGQASDTGTGLGLALVKQLVESHGGTVGVESVVDRGATFFFTLPVAAQAVDAEPAPPRLAPRLAALTPELHP